MIPKKNIVRALRKSLAQPSYAWQNLRHRLRSVASYHLYNGRSYWPETISLFLTYKCNLRCKMCGQWGVNGAFAEFSRDLLRQRLSPTEIKALIENVAFFKPNITLFGGEPMLHPDWLEIVKIVKQAGLRCNIVTNGTLVGKYAQEILASGLDEIILSLDGPAEIHDKIRRVPGAYQTTIDGFHHLNRLKTRANSQKPIININCTLFEENYRYMTDVSTAAKMIQSKGVTFHHLLFLSKPTVNRFLESFRSDFGQTPGDWIGFAREKPPSIDASYLIEQAHQLTRKNQDIDIAFYPNFTPTELREWYSGFEFEARSYKNRCLSLWMTAYIFPDGHVRPYHTMNFSPGNIRNAKFTDIWNNPTYRSYRRYIKKNKKFPVCSKGCTEFFRY